MTMAIDTDMAAALDVQNVLSTIAAASALDALEADGPEAVPANHRHGDDSDLRRRKWTTG
jgi:hypothetical protein